MKFYCFFENDKLIDEMQRLSNHRDENSINLVVEIKSVYGIGHQPGIVWLEVPRLLFRALACY